MTAPLQYGTEPPSDPTAVMGRRTLAWLADLVLYAVVVAVGLASMTEYVDIPPGIAVEEACDVLEAQQGELPGGCFAYEDRVYLLDDTESGVQTMLSLGWFVLFVVLQGVTGGSPGKLLFGLRVVDQYGNKAGIGKSLGRTLLWVVDGAPWFVPLVGPITALTSTGHRRVGDLAAGTYVVSSSRVGSPVMPTAAAPPAGQPSWGAAPPTAPPEPAWTSPAPAFPSTPDQGWEAPAPAESPSAETSPFAAPGSEAPPAAAAAPGPTPPTPSEPPRHELPPPQWDAARNTYIQWDPNRQAWLQWDTAREQWKPIDT